MRLQTRPATKLAATPNPKMRRTPSSSSSLKRNSNNSNNATKNTKKRKRFSPRSFLECQSITHVVGFPPQHELVTNPVASDFVKELFLDRFVKEIVKPFQPENKKISNRDGTKTTAPTTEINAGCYHVMVGGKLVKRRRISQDNIQPNRTTTKTPLEKNHLTDGIDDELTRKRAIWKENIVIGTNQCLRVLENLHTATCREDETGLKGPSTSNKTSIENPSDNRQALRKPSLIVIAKDIYPPTMCCAVPVLAKALGIPLLILPGKASLELGRALNAKRTSILIFCCGDNGAKGRSNDALGKRDHQDTEMSASRAAIASFVSFIKDQLPQNTNKL